MRKRRRRRRRRRSRELLQLAATGKPKGRPLNQEARSLRPIQAAFCGQSEPEASDASSPVIDAQTPREIATCESCTIFVSAFSTRRGSSARKSFRRPGRRKERTFFVEPAKKNACTHGTSSQVQTTSRTLCSILTCLMAIIILTSKASVGQETLGIGVDRHLSIQTKQGIFRGLLIPSQVNDWPGDLRSARSGNNFSDMIVGFLGIRYASAPVRRLRFMPPTAYLYSNQSPNQVHNMQKFGPICWQRFPVDVDADTLAGAGNKPSREDRLQMQLSLIKSFLPVGSFAELRPLIRRLSAFEQSEDCLNLNVYAPLRAFKSHPPSNGSIWPANSQADPPPPPPPAKGAQLPVLVIIHSESFDYGSGSAINALNFVHQTGLIVVTFNFRLNVLGFPPKLAGGSLRGNLGLMDQVAALHWTRDNIEAFGGSPDNITLMGTKRASIAVNLLMLSPLAKGLFQRAIMEDGSALTPLIANHIVAPAHLAGPGNTSPSLHHLRLLARLSDCPVYLAGPGKSGNASSSSSVQGGPQQPHQPSMPLAPPPTHLSNNEAGQYSDEIKTNALTIECLRQKPIEQITQRIPLDLLHFDQVTGDISMPLRWLRVLSQVSQQTTSTKRTTTRTTTNTNNFAPLNYTLNAKELNKLILAATKVKLEQQSGRHFATSNDDEGASDNSDLFNLVEHLRASSELNGLFRDIFGQPSANMQPVFGPIMDGTIVPNEDFSLAMLKTNSTFGQRDLLIGLSRPNIVKQAALRARPQTKPPDEEGQTGTGAREEELRFHPDRFVADRFSSHLQRTGLSSEQAVDLINVFVRSFYRHHNQEIANSIINNYLNGRQSSRVVAYRSPSFALINLEDANKEDTGKVGANETDLAQQERQLWALESVLEMFQDALTSVPVLKAALIHATKQLDFLVDAFVGQEFDKWSAKIGAEPSNGFPATRSDLYQQFDQKSILESFTKFAKTLFADPNWPLELRSQTAPTAPSNRPTLAQPKSTYLYQLDSSLAPDDLHRFERNFVGANRAGPSWFQRACSNILSALSAEFNAWNGRQVSQSIACAVDPTLFDGEPEGFSKTTSLFARFRGGFCARMSLLVAHFASSGRMNSRQLDDLARAEKIPLAERLDSHHDKCIAGRQSDTHSVQSGEAEAEASFNDMALNSRLDDAQTCQIELETLVIDYFVEEFESFKKREDSNSTNELTIGETQQWATFDLFTQQVASLNVVAREAGSIKMSPISLDDTTSSLSAQNDPKLSLLGRSSFWLNFIPALNCSKTLPIIPNNPLVTVSSSSLLLNLNLQFSCQKGGKTVYNILEHLAVSIKQQLEARASQWLANRFQSSSSQSSSDSFSEHQQMLSIANMSKSDEDSSTNNADQQELSGAENQANTHSNYSLKANKANLGNDGSQQTTDTLQSIESRNDVASSKAFIDLRSRYIGMVLLICGLVIGLTLATGACSLLRSNHNKNKNNQRKHNRKGSRQEQPHLQAGGPLEPPMMMQEQQQISSGNIECNHQAQHVIVHDTDEQFVELESSSGGRQQLIINNNNNNNNNNIDQTLNLDADNYDYEPSLTQLESCDIVMQEQQSQQEHDCLSEENNHVCAVTNQAGNFVCWPAMGADSGAANDYLGVCRSHSSLSSVKLMSDQEQPIMLPILSKTPADYESRVTFEADNCNADNHYGGSSSETQVQSSGSSTTRKRVKISDPLATARRTNNRSRLYSYQSKQQNEPQADYNANNAETPLYCPIHRNQSNSLLSMASSGYFVDGGRTFVANTDNFELWNNVGHLEPMVTGQYQHHQYRHHNGRSLGREKTSNSSFGIISGAIPNQQAGQQQQQQQHQQLIPNGYLVAQSSEGPFLDFTQTTDINVNSQRIQ